MADTMLFGTVYDSENPDCFTNGTSMNRYKAEKHQAEASGTLAYFKIHIPSNTSVAGCTHDDIVWLVFEGTAGSNIPGALKAYGWHDNYNWVTGGGVGAYHTFAVTNTVTNLTVTQGNYYWIAMYDYALNPGDVRVPQDLTIWDEAGCLAQVQQHRHSGDPGCPTPIDLGTNQFSKACVNSSCDVNECYEDRGEVGTALPDTSCFETLVATGNDLSAWATDTTTTTTVTAQGISITGVQIQ